MTEDEIVTLLDEWIDDLAPLNREAFRPAARALLGRLEGGGTVSDEAPRLVVADEARDLDFPAADGRILAIGSAESRVVPLGLVPVGAMVTSYALAPDDAPVYWVVGHEAETTRVRSLASGAYYDWPGERMVETR